MLFVCHPKFCIWYVMVFLEGSIVRKLSRHYRRRIQVLHPNNFRSVSLFSCLIVLFLCFFFSILFSRALEIPVFYLVSVYAFMLGFAFFFSSFVYYAITVCFLTCCLHALLIVFISACYVIFTCLLHIVASFFSACPSILFPWLSVCFIYLIVLSHCHFALGFLYNCLVTTWSRFLLIKV